MKTHQLMHPRVEELLVERALRPLTDAEVAELEALGGADDETLDLAAAALVVATLRVEEMPEELVRQIAEPTMINPRDAGIHLITKPEIDTERGIGANRAHTADRENVVPIRRKRRFVTIAIAAAATIAIALGAWRLTRPKGVIVDGTPIAWQTTPDPAAKGASGDIVWNNAEQRGYMRFVGLQVNDPTQWQYQLWIFDKGRDQAYPVDGGVFDISSTGEVIVPIDPKLRVGDATMFAVTIEKPGGVVVSKRERIVVLAKTS